MNFNSWTWTRSVSSYLPRSAIMMIGKRRWRRRRGNGITAAFVPPPPPFKSEWAEREEIREKQGCKRIEATAETSSVDDLLRCQRRRRRRRSIGAILLMDGGRTKERARGEGRGSQRPLIKSDNEEMAAAACHLVSGADLG